MVQTNNELYVYPEKGAPKHTTFLILSSILQMRQLETVEFDLDLQWQEFPKLFPIELKPGGSYSPMIIYFDNQECQQHWLQQILKASSAYKIESYYEINEEHEMNE